MKSSNRRTSAGSELTWACFRTDVSMVRHPFKGGERRPTHRATSWTEQECCLAFPWPIRERSGPAVDRISGERGQASSTRSALPCIFSHDVHQSSDLDDGGPTVWGHQELGLRTRTVQLGHPGVHEQKIGSGCFDRCARTILIGETQAERLVAPHLLSQSRL